MNIRECVREGLNALFRVLGVSIITGLAFTVAAIAFVVPGLIVMTFFWVAVPITVMEGDEVGASLRRSAYLTKGNRWPVFAIVVTTFILLIISNIPAFLVSEGSNLIAFALGLFAFLLSAFAVTLWAVVSAVSYHDLRFVKEGIALEQIMANHAASRISSAPASTID